MFTIRENDPFAGKITLYFVAGGGFVANKRTVNEREFLNEVRQYLDRKSGNTLHQSEENGQVVSVLPEKKTVKLRKTATA
jgi:hypothetical protein